MTRVAVVALPLLLALGAALTAQEWHSYSGSGSERVQGRSLAVTGQRAGGLGYLLIEMVNTAGEPHDVRASYSSVGYGDHVIAAQRATTLQANETARWFLPLPTSPAAVARVEIFVDGRPLDSQHESMAGGDHGLAALLVSERANRRLEALGWIARGDAGSRGGTKELRVVAGAELAPDWTLLSTFDAVLVDDSAALPAEAQETLRRYAAAGGTVVVQGRAALRAGPLQQALREHGNDQRIGGGRIVAIDRWSADADVALGGLGTRLIGGVAPSALHVPSDLPGLGRVPVRAFLLVLLAFAVAVGPLNFFWCMRRKRQPLLLLATLPALGLGTTAAILLWGTFSEGFGVQGSLRSISLLDQQQHEVTAWTTRTLYAGLSPSRCLVPPGAVVDCLQAVAFVRQGESVHSRVETADGLEGGVLPSRTPTTLVTSQQGAARDRLRFRATGDGWELLQDASLQVRELLLRDADGRCFRKVGNRLEACADAQFDAAVESVCDLLQNDSGSGSLEVQWQSGSDTLVAGQLRMQVGERLRAVWGGRRPPPGTWFGRVEQAPWLVDHGLHEQVANPVHLVYGRCADEDFVR